MRRRAQRRPDEQGEDESYNDRNHHGKGQWSQVGAGAGCGCTASTHLLFIGKNLERIGDHATNIAEMVYFAATGEQLGERTKGGDALVGAS